MKYFELIGIAIALGAFFWGFYNILEVFVKGLFDKDKQNNTTKKRKSKHNEI